MANHISSKKSIRKTMRRSYINKIAVSKLRSTIKKLVTLIESNDKKGAMILLPAVQSELMKNVSKGTMKKNTASRKISRLSVQIKKIV
jgi:small subunit ribosomal protein S20